VATALIMTQVGLSGALGAFLAGVLLADSDYRHELESNIEPFKGLLLGLFFMAVGMNADVWVALTQPALVLAVTAALVGVKAAVLFGIGRYIGLGNRHAGSLAVAISQGGEFAFVLFEVAHGAHVLDESLQSVLVLAVTLSMVVTPLLFMVRDQLERRLVRADGPTVDAMNQEFEHAPVIIAGFGRYGQIVGRLLRARRIPFTALDSNIEHIDFLRKFGNKVFYGDAQRADLLRAAGAEHAHVLHVAVDDVQSCLNIVRTAKENFPHLRLFVRARNRQHVFLLMNEGVEHIMRETFHSSIQSGGAILTALGLPSSQVAEALRRFEEFDENAVREQAKNQNDEASLVAYAKRVATDLERIFEDDEKAEEQQ
jgi:voltage-gated potassium channel Kch